MAPWLWLLAPSRPGMLSDHFGVQVRKRQTIDMGTYILYLVFCLGVVFSPILP